MGEIIGRLKELKTLRQLQMSDKSEFVALYGRRRVGKTFLVRTVCEDKFTFQVTGIANVTLQQQLGNFHSACKGWTQPCQTKYRLTGSRLLNN